jgi:CBS domain-containing protein
MSVKVCDVMTRAIIYGSVESTVTELAALMREGAISSVVIRDETRIVGIVTQLDIVSKVIAVGADPRQVKASEIMSAPVATIDSDADIEEAARIMRDRRIKKLVAVKDGRVEGIVTSFDLVVAEPVIRLLVEKGM